MTADIHENTLIASLAASFSRSPRQLNALQESDAELISLNGYTVLALTTDAIAEEIASGLYADPWLAGWMAVMVNFSDLAAVGAEPLGILIAETLPRSQSREASLAVQKGIQDACAACGSHVLGGDTNSGEMLHLAGTAVGLISGGRPLTRLGIRPGDLIFATGKLGRGNAFAAQQLGVSMESSFTYRPVARLREGVALRRFATACMDTSDGALATLDQLARLNGVGFSFNPEWASALDPGALSVAEMMGIPPWVFLAGPHGEFELLLAASRENAQEVRDALSECGGEWCQIASATSAPGLLLPGLGMLTPEDLAAIRNLEIQSKGSISFYLRSLLDIGRTAQHRTPN
jgi:thiamine-monophosphate kinase